MRRLVLFFALLALSCGGTGRTRRTFPVEVSGRSAPLTTDSGWAVSLTRARLELESLRFFSGKVLLGEAPWWRRALVSEAWAHPGHYVPGEALGELVAPLELDLLAATPTAWGTAGAVTGAYGSAELTLAGRGLTVEGTAQRGGATVAFSASFLPAKPLAGLRFEHEVTSAPGGVHVEVDLAAVLSRVDFGLVGASASPLDVTSPAYNGLARGVEDTSVFVISWREP